MPCISTFNVYSSVVFSYIHRVVQVLSLSHFTAFLWAPKEMLLPCLQHLSNYYLLSVTVPVGDISNNWGHTTCGLLWLAPFAQHSVFSRHLRCGVHQHFIPFYRQVKFRCLGMLPIAYLFIGWWTFGLCSCFGCYV